jgi:energy-converting hydrogenase B subunit D
MIAAQVLAALLVGVTGTLVVTTRETVHQVLVFGVFGLALALAFLLLQAPDAALAQLVVSGLVMPLLVVVVLAELRGRSR